MADLQHKLDELLDRSWRALDSYRNDIVLVGGLATQYFPRHPAFIPPPMIARVTVDVDVALANPTQPHGRTSIPLALKDGHLVEYITVDAAGRPVEACFQLEEDGTRGRADVHLEFLVPLQGRVAVSPGHPQTGLIAHALRYVDLLLYKPIVINDHRLGRMLLPHPISYIVQKTCIRANRQAKGKSATDQADIVFTIWGFREWWNELAGRWHELAEANHEWAAWLRRTREHLGRLYETADGIGSLEVQDVFASQQGIAVTAEEISRVMGAFLAHVDAT